MLMTYVYNCTYAINQTGSIKIIRYEDFPPSTLAIDPQGTFACVIPFMQILCFDISLNRTIRHSNNDIWEKSYFMHTQALIITEDHRLLLTGYRILDEEPRFVPYLYFADFSDPANPTLIDRKSLLSPGFTKEIDVFKRHGLLPLFFHHESKMLIVGIPHLECIYIFSIEKNALDLVKNHSSPEKNILFGKSVAMIDVNSYAVLAYSLPTLPWSSSQIQVNLLIYLFKMQ